MATFKVSQYGESSSAIINAADISPEEKLKICLAGAEVVRMKCREWLEQNTSDPSSSRGTLANSLAVTSLTESALVEPKGIHHGKSTRASMKKSAGYHRAKTGQGKGQKSGHHGMSGGTSAMDVGYYLEYGTPRMPARHWMESSVEAAEEETTAAMAEAWDELLKSKGL